MPRTVRIDPTAFQRQDLAERRFAQESQNEAEKLSLAQQTALLQKARMVFDIVQARQAAEDKTQQTLHAAAIIQKMGALNINDPEFETKRADILSAHAPGLSMAENYVKQKDSI